MSGLESPQGLMFSYVSLEQRVPKQLPLRVNLRSLDKVLTDMNGALTVMHSHMCRPSIPWERLIRALLLQIFFSVRSERQLMEQLDYNLLFRWFVSLEVGDAAWDARASMKSFQR